MKPPVWQDPVLELLQEKGLFFDETWRLHPSICEFTSELYYRGGLHSKSGLDGQLLSGKTKFAGTGLFVVPVEHSGCQSISPAEVEAVVKAIDLSLGEINEIRR